jgi:hypothetical protein
MAITDFSFALCVSTQQYKAEDMVRLVGETASRISGASSTHDDNRVFWDFSNDIDVSFDVIWPTVVDWATRRVDVLASMEDAIFTLWCTIYTNTEFVDLALQAAHIQALGLHKINLMISAYTEPVVE